MKKLVFAFLIITFLFSCKQEHKKDKKVNDKVLKKSKPSQEVLESSQKTKPIRELKPEERRLYSRNLDVIKKESYFNIKNNYIQIKIPVDNSNFKIYESRWLTKGGTKTLIIGISDTTPIPTRGRLGNYIIDKKIPFSKINGTYPNLNTTDKLTVIVINDDRFHKFGQSEIRAFIKGIENNHKNFQPEEKGGGIILTGP